MVRRSNISNVKYTEVIDKILTYIRNNCENVDSNYNNFATHFKTNVSKDVFKLITPNRSTMLSMNSNGNISQVTYADVQNDLNNYCETIGVTSSVKTTNIDDNNFLLFLAHMRFFLSTRLVYIVGDWIENDTIVQNGGSAGTVTTIINTDESKRYLIYKNDAFDAQELADLSKLSNISINSSSEEPNPISMDKLEKQLQTLLNTIKYQKRVVPIGYTYTMT